MRCWLVAQSVGGGAALAGCSVSQRRAGRFVKASSIHPWRLRRVIPDAEALLHGPPAASFSFGVACAAGCRFGYRLRRFVWLRCCLRRWVSLWVSPAPLPLASVLPAPLGVALGIACAASFSFGVACAAGCRFGYRLCRFLWLRCCLRRWVSLWKSSVPLCRADVKHRIHILKHRVRGARGPEPVGGPPAPGKARAEAPWMALCRSAERSGPLATGT